MAENDLVGLEVSLSECLDGCSWRVCHGNVTVDGIRHGKRQILSLIVRIDGCQILQRNDHRAAAVNCQVQIAADDGGYVAHLGGQTSALLHGELAVLDIAADLTGAPNVDQVADDDIALEHARDVRVVSPCPALEAAAFVNVNRLGGKFAVNATINLCSAAITDFASNERVFTDNKNALVRIHCPSPHNSWPV